MIKALCNEVSESRLNVLVNSTNTATIIRYAPTNMTSYFAVRLVCINFPLKSEVSRFSQNDIRALLHLNSEGDRTYKIGFPGLLMSDSRIVICHNELAGEIISNLFLESKKILSDHVSTFKYNIEIPHKRSERLNDSNCLYGNSNSYKQKYACENILFQPSQKTLHQQTKVLLQKLKRKGRRLLKKSLTLEPIKTKEIKIWKTLVNG